MTDPQPIAGHFNVNCQDIMLAKPPLPYGWLRFDSNNDCNLHCAYCHNSRSAEIMELDTFRDFLERNVTGVENFQFGCRMEPTLDQRLVTFMEALHASPVRASQSVVLQTNATLLNRHDSARMVAAGLTDMQISIDTLNPASFAELRGGARIERILRNIERFSAAQPEVRIKFIATVSTTNLADIEDLIAFAASVGARAVILREMFHMPGTAHMDDARVARMVLPTGAFDAMAEQMQERFAGQIILNCINTAGVSAHAARVQAHSYANRPLTSA